MDFHQDCNNEDDIIIISSDLEEEQQQEENYGMTEANIVGFSLATQENVCYQCDKQMEQVSELGNQLSRAEKRICELEQELEDKLLLQSKLELAHKRIEAQNKEINSLQVDIRLGKQHVAEQELKVNELVSGVRKLHNLITHSLLMGNQSEDGEGVLKGNPSGHDLQQKFKQLSELVRKQGRKWVVMQSRFQAELSRTKNIMLMLKHNNCSWGIRKKVYKAPATVTKPNKGFTEKNTEKQSKSHDQDLSFDGNGFRCKCGMVYKHKSSLATHIRAMQIGKVYPCNFCHKRFARRHSLHIHMRHIHDVVKYIRRRAVKRNQQPMEGNNLCTHHPPPPALSPQIPVSADDPSVPSDLLSRRWFAENGELQNSHLNTTIFQTLRHNNIAAAKSNLLSFSSQ